MKFDDAITPIPRSIVKALCSVQASVESVAKSGFNKHGQYKFSSVDDIYAALTHKLGAAGLIIMPIEMTPVEETTATVPVFDKDGAKTGDKQVTKLRFHFGYVLCTEEDTWFDPRSARSLIMLHTGPQTFNAAESFCQKAYLRALLKMPTGEKDLDEFAQDESFDEQVAGNGKTKPTALRKSAAASKRDGTTQVFNEIKEKIAKSAAADQCQQVWLLYGEELNGMARRWFDLLCEEFVDRMEKFGIEIDLDPDGWPILETREAA